MTFAIKTKVLLCITFLEDFSSHLTDTLITLKTDMQTQFWFKTLIVYTYSIIYSIISETFRVSICNHQFPAGFLLNQPTQPTSVLEVMCGILASLVCRRGVPTGEKNRHMSWATHGGLFLPFMVWKNIVLDANPRMLLDEGECFWCQQKFGRVCWHFFLRRLETSKQQAETFWLKHSKPSVFPSSCRCLWRSWFLTRFHKASKRWFVLYVNADMAFFQICSWPCFKSVLRKCYLISPTFNMVMNTPTVTIWVPKRGENLTTIWPWEFLRWKEKIPGPSCP